MLIWREVSIASHWPSKLDVHPQAVEPTIRRSDGQHGQPQISIGIGPANELAATTVARVPTYLSVTYYTSVDCPPASCEASASSTSPWQAQALVMPGSVRAPP